MMTLQCFPSGYVQKLMLMFLDLDYGATIPHPIELIKRPQILKPDCDSCKTHTDRENYIITSLPVGLSDYTYKRGPMLAYMAIWLRNKRVNKHYATMGQRNNCSITSKSQQTKIFYKLVCRSTNLPH